MPDHEVVIAHLRRPGRKDRRNDPFWEFGSFGITGCHASNLLSSKSAKKLNGRRIAFAQGGTSGTRLVLLTPPVSVHRRGVYFEAKWRDSEAGMPFRYTYAPILTQNDSRSLYVTDFPRLAAEYATGSRTPEGNFASRFRSRVSPLEPHLAKEIIAVYERMRKRAGTDALASTYDDALPLKIACPEIKRRSAYKRLLLEAQCSSTACDRQATSSNKSRRTSCR